MSLIAETANPLLEQMLATRLGRRDAVAGRLGVLDGLATRMGLLQHTLRPAFHKPQLVLVAADHGIAVDHLRPEGSLETAQIVEQLLDGRLPLGAIAQASGLNWQVVDAGLAQAVTGAPHERLLPRKIAHGARHARVGPAMSIEQAHAAIRAGMEIGDNLAGNAVACAGLGVGSDVAAAMLLARLGDVPVGELLQGPPGSDAAWLAHRQRVAQAALNRHADISDPVEVLAALGGFEIAMLAGLMLVAASKRHLVLADGMAACAALTIATRIAPAVPDYVLFCRSSSSLGLDRVLAMFHAGVLLDLGLDTLDGTGACLSWPLVRGATALLASDTEDSVPAGMPRPQAASLYDPDDSTMDGWRRRGEAG